MTNKSVSSSQHLIARRILEVKDKKVLPLACESVDALPVESLGHLSELLAMLLFCHPETILHVMFV